MRRNRQLTPMRGYNPLDWENKSSRNTWQCSGADQTDALGAVQLNKHTTEPAEQGSTIRTPKRRGFTLIPNGVLQEGKVSARAWGLYVYLLSRPPGWDIRTSQLQKVFTEGRDAIYVAMRQLVAADLMILETYRNPEGLPRKRYIMVDPDTINNSPNTDFQDTDFQAPENTGVTTTNLTSTDISQHLSVTSDSASDQQKPSSTSKDFLSRAATAEPPRNPGGLPQHERKQLRDKLVTVGQLLQEGYGFYDGPTQNAWSSFANELLRVMGQDEYDDKYADLIDNGKWTVSKKVATAYGAGRELNTLIATANNI